jgi:hypothetical protein
MPQHRLHDKHKSEKDRYWYNLLATTLTNSILYPEYNMLLYISPNITEHRLSNAIFILNKLSNFSYQTVEMEYIGTEPAIWRMMPLWRRDVEVFHTRDIDSVPTEIEYRYTRAFEHSSCAIGTLRTHQNHYGIKCRMLAGLSSFKPEKVPFIMKFDSFYTYYAMKHGNYGSDQDLMIERFTSSPEFTKNHFFDHKAYDQANSQDFPCIGASEEELSRIKPNNEQKMVFSLQKECNLDNWAGEPVDARGKYTKHLLSRFPRVENKILENNELKSFYGVK